MEEKKTDSLGGMKFKAPITPPAIPASRPPVIPVAKKEDITIRTMQDDIAEIGTQKPSLPLAKGEIKRGSTLDPSTHTTTTKTFPLPPANVTKNQKVVINPFTAGRQTNWRLFIGAGAAVIVILGGLGFGAWYWLNRDTGNVPPESVAEAAAVIPANADLVVAYSLTSAEDRTAATDLWSSKGEASLSGLLQGDPRLLVANNEITQFYYVIANGDPRPYLLVPQSSASKDLLTDTYDVTVNIHEGWYVAHQIDPNIYIESLKQGTLAGSKQATLLKKVSETSAVSALVRGNPLATVRSAFAGKKGTKGSFQAIAVNLKTSITNKSLVFDGIAEASVANTTTTPQLTSKRLLEAIPADATAVHLGANLAADIKQWQDSGAGLRADILAQSSVTQVLNSLSVPYVWYTRTGADNLPDTGLVVDLSTVTPQPVLGEAGIEQGLAAFIPLVMEQPLNTPVAFKDGAYAEVPIRFVNILGASIALDYGIANNFLMIASSKEGMFSVIDTVAKRIPSASTSIAWQPLFTEWGTIPEAKDIIFGSFSLSSLQSLLPLGSAEPVKMGVSIKTVNNESEVKGFFLISPKK